jgi:hypothetical protein
MPVTKRRRLVLSLILTRCKVQSTNSGRQAKIGMIGHDGGDISDLRIVAITQPTNSPTQRQHNGNTKSPIFGARSARKLQRGTFPKFCRIFLRCIY